MMREGVIEGLTANEVTARMHLSAVLSLRPSAVELLDKSVLAER
jgi:hypothetical protein